MRAGLGGFGAKNGVGYTIRTVEGGLLFPGFCGCGKDEECSPQGRTKEGQPAARQNGSGVLKKMVVDARGTA